jgi:hypothetical protein
MSGRTLETRGRSITARPSPAEKARFSTLAHAAGISESRLALLAIRAFVDGEGGTQGDPECATAAERVRATDRITIRLRPGDGAVIARRARERGVKTATYLAAMARAHIAADPPLFAQELAALKQSIAILAGLGTLLGQNLRSPTASVARTEELRQVLSRTRAAVAALEQRTHDFTKAALMAWESRFDE